MHFDGNFTTEPSVTTTELPFPHNDHKYLIVPLVVIILVMLLSALVYLMARKRRLSIMRHNLLSLYDFDSNEQEWESLNNYDNPNYTQEYSNTNL